METLKNGLQVEVTETAPCCISLKAVVPAAQAKKTYSDILTQYMSNVRLPGFRAGHVPQKMVLRNYGKEILAEAAQQLLNRSMDAIVSEKELRIAGELKLADDKMPEYVLDADYAFEASMEVFTAIEAPEYKGIELTKTVKKVTDKEVDETVDTFLHMRGTYEVVERAAEAGDMVKVDYTTDASDELKAIPEAKYQLEGNNAWQIMREPESLPGITAILSGVKAGESKDATITFPEDFRVKALAGQSIAYHFTVKEVHGFTYPEMNEEFFKQFGATDKESMRANIRQHLEGQQSQQQYQEQMTQAIEKLTAGQTFPLPPTLLAADKKSLVDAEVNKRRQRQVAEEEITKAMPEIEADAQKQAEDNNRLVQVLDKIADVEKIEVTNMDFAGYCAMMGQQHGMKPEQVMKTIQKDRNAFNGVIGNILRQKALSLVVKEAKVTEVEAPAAE